MLLQNFTKKIILSFLVWYTTLSSLIPLIVKFYIAEIKKNIISKVSFIIDQLNWKKYSTNKNNYSENFFLAKYHISSHSFSAKIIYVYEKEYIYV